MKRSAFVGGSMAALGLATGARAIATVGSSNSFSLESNGISATWAIVNGALRMSALADRTSGQQLAPVQEVFQLTFANGIVRKCSEFAVVTGPAVAQSAAEPTASRLSARMVANTVSVELRDAQTGTRVTWRAIASDGATYLRQQVTIAAEKAPLTIRDVRLLDFAALRDAEQVGRCAGSPIVAGTIYASIEHPFATCDAYPDEGSAIGHFSDSVDVVPGAPLVLSCVIGSTKTGQLRRDFLTYVERERAHPYRTFLHYNSWYDLGGGKPYVQSECLDRIHAFGQSLHAERAVTLKSFLFDDGWDDPTHLWTFNSSFPSGFTPLRDAAAQYAAAPGAWLSPWGGYGDPKRQRLAAAKLAGYETDTDGLALSGPKYYQYFHEVVMRFIQQGGVNQFKIDGTGSLSTVLPGSRFGNNFEAAISVIDDMRSAEPDIYVNLTTGTYPSPFWLRYCDSIWRGGNDHDFTGVGSHRQRWITYRDADTYAGIVTQGPLYPLNSLMLHGMIYAQHAFGLADDPNNDFRDEVRSYFGTGTQLQEMYITPALLSAANWDDIAEAAKWSATNADVLSDTHWIGGDPERLNVYGWAAWSPRKGIIVVRNPSDRQQSIPIDVGAAFELPESAPTNYLAQSPWHDARGGPIKLQAGREHLFALDPFEVRTLDVLPQA